jgi:gas vesicle protein
MTKTSKKASHLGVGMMVGSIMGLAAGFFLQSRKGKELTKDAEKKAVQLQGKIMKKLEKMNDLSKEKYAEVVDDVLAYYEKSQDIAKKEIPEVRAMLLKK